MKNENKSKDWSVGLANTTFGDLLVLGRKFGVGDERRRERKQTDFADGIGKSVDQTRNYEQNTSQPPEDVFYGRLKPGENESDPKGIIPFFTRENADRDELEFLEALKAAYENWPNKPAKPPEEDKPEDGQEEKSEHPTRAPRASKQQHGSSWRIALILLTVMSLMAVVSVSFCYVNAKQGVGFCGPAIFGEININSPNQSPD